MRWQIGRRSGNVEDRRGMGGGIAKGGGGLIIVALIVWAMGGDPTPLLVESASQYMKQPAKSRYSEAEQAEKMDFVAAVLGNTEDVWASLSNGQYRQPKLVVFAGATQTACGTGRAATGPFYCPLDNKLYLDLNFFYELEHKLHSPGDFAQAYVIAHEVGHHVQFLTGTLQKVNAQQQSLPRTEANALSVKTELQADCYAGVWAHHAGAEYQMLEAGDVEEALNAATQIGDDQLQKEAQGYVVPDSFTHGTSKQRYDWFKRGFDSGKPDDCDTFK